MITITRRLSRRLRAVFRRALPASPRGPALAVTFEATSRSLQIRARHETVAVTYQQPGNFTPEQMVLPMTLLDDCAGARDDAVTLEATRDPSVLAHWYEAGVRQAAVYLRPPAADATNCPQLPRKLAENPPRLIAALRDASDTTGTATSRHALDHLQLRSRRSEVVATDGRQLLVERGFLFPWQDDVLIGRSRVWELAELAAVPTVFIGCSGDWVTLVAGPWTLQFAINAVGRYPRTEELLRPVAAACSSCRWSPKDRRRLRRNLQRLPASDEPESPVTIDWNGRFAVRARGAGMHEPAEIQLPEARPIGQPVRIATNRWFLQRAARLGLRELHVFGADVPLLASDGHRSYVWLSLSERQVIAPVRAMKPAMTQGAA